MRRGNLLSGGLCLAALIAVNSPSLGQAVRSAGERPDNARVFDAAWDGIRQNYYDPDAVDADWRRTRDRFRPLAVAAGDERELYIVINTMLRTLNDGHTIAAPPSYIARSNRSGSEGPGVGLGINLSTRSDGWHVTEVTAGGPGDAAGLKIGTVILEVDGRPFDGFFQLQANIGMALSVRDPDGTVRATTLLPQPSNASDDRITRMMDGEVLYVHFLSFRSGTADWLERQLDARPGSRGMILDLRGNGGGSASEAAKTAALFLDPPFQFGRIVSRVRRHEEDCNRAISMREAKKYSAPVVILIDRYSFSSAELVSSVMQSSGRAEIVGERSGGEVSCMTTLPLPDGGALRVSVATYVTANGGTLSRTGVMPDVAAAGQPDQRHTGPDLALEEARLLLATALSE